MDNTSLPAQKQERHYGLDLLKILSMFMILFLHYFCYGELRAFPSGQLDIPGVFMWWLYALTYMAVDCYVLISGYFLVDQPFRFNRLVKLILNVTFYSVGIEILLLLLGKVSFSVKVIKCFLPISFKYYWFVTAYVGLYLLTPVINHFIRTLNKKQHLSLVLMIFIMLSLWRDIIPTLDSPFFANATYSLPLFIELYFIASYIRLYVDIQKIKYPLTVYFMCTFVMVAVWFISRIVYSRIVDLSVHIPSDYYYRNNSAVVILGAVGLFIAFLKLHINNAYLVKTIKLIAPLTLGVYLIHEHNELRMLLWNTVVSVVELPRNLLTPVYTLLVTIVIYTILLTIDFLRAKLFSLLERGVWYKNTMQKIDNTVHGISVKLIDRLAQIGE